MAQHPSRPQAVRTGPLEIRPAERVVLVESRVISLTACEMALLLALAEREGRVVERAVLGRVVRGHPPREGDRSVDVYVSRLRRKLAEAAPGWRLIHTHFGIGYRLSPEGGVSASGGSFHIFFTRRPHPRNTLRPAPVRASSRPAGSAGRLSETREKR